MVQRTHDGLHCTALHKLLLQRKPFKEKLMSFDWSVGGKGARRVMNNNGDCVPASHIEREVSCSKVCPANTTEEREKERQTRGRKRTRKWCARGMRSMWKWRVQPTDAEPAAHAQANTAFCSVESCGGCGVWSHLLSHHGGTSKPSGEKKKSRSRLKKKTRVIFDFGKSARSPGGHARFAASKARPTKNSTMYQKTNKIAVSSFPTCIL